MIGIISQTRVLGVEDREKFRKKLVLATEQSAKLLVSCSEDQLQLSWILID